MKLCRADIEEEEEEYDPLEDPNILDQASALAHILCEAKKDMREGERNETLESEPLILGSKECSIT